MNDRTSLLLVPGLTCNSNLWRHQIDALSGIADVWVSPLPAYNHLGAMADDILADAPERFHLVGLSMGGYIGFEILKRAPERVLSVCFMSTSANAETLGVTLRRQQSIAEAQNATYTEMMRGLIPRFLAPRNVHRPEVMDVMLKQAHETGLNAYIQHQHAMMRPRDYRDVLADIKCPALVTCGREDGVTTVKDHQDMARGIPGAEMIVIEGSGHMVPLEAPQATTNLLLDWLETPLSIAA